MRIEIIGGMGVGKTTLCRALERHSLNCVYESLEKNPYLALSYTDPQRYGFYSQISFVLGNFFSAVKAQARGGTTFLDFSTITDKAYASMFLHGKARSIALDMIEYLEEKEGRADLYLYLTCSAEMQLQRIRGRNRPHEKTVDLEFVRQLDSYLTHFVHRAELDGARILMLDTELPDMIYDENYVTGLTAKIRHVIESPYARPLVQGVGTYAPATIRDEAANTPQYVEMAQAV